MLNIYSEFTEYKDDEVKEEIINMMGYITSSKEVCAVYSLGELIKVVSSYLFSHAEIDKFHFKIDYDDYRIIIMIGGISLEDLNIYQEWINSNVMASTCFELLYCGVDY